ncbi:type VI secretion system baseplate subunit TssE [Burkholderia dolosa]|uniref:type VI secretion system baseplate subunit TssE n=1 Tax=Burkholderia dolosa TaxID=152500 RepID=UPI00159282CB|nr:type VI secretion system baseplate subunit TssE [Burkholderia dolosa]MBR8056178.1 type VI secretion system baseplate subunit TssE [Burkholderia dolosa]MBR8300523.1 type VI secretion system baseplate subunit TssE [Burkholderia dolosa]MBY4750875.1 type VI secretion system baseplate subunit TssE [Burkholderia dolosa]
MARDPDGQHQPAYLPSLLDRLQDDAPHARHESPAAYAPNGEGMRRIIRRDLASLLNATNLDGELDVGRYPQAAASVVNYGLPPLSGSYLSDRNWETVEKLVRTAIVRFEPRLLPESIAIRPVEGREAVSYNQLTFEIRGLMQWSPYPLEFRIQSTFDIESNKVALDPDTRPRH